MRLAIVCVLASLLPAAAHAQALDMSQGGAIDVTSRDGMEWRQNEQEVIARGDARAVRGNVTVTADTLIAFYRKKAGSPAAAPAKPAAIPTGAVAGAGDTGANEIYRLEAIGNVRIFTPTDLAVGDKAIYDIDQAVLLLTGKAMTITTPNQVMTARDTMEYWSQKHMAVGRGDATVTTSDGRRINADVLVGYTQPDQPGARPAGAKSAAGPPPTAQPAAAKPPAKPGADPLLASGKLQKAEAFGHVKLRTATETITGNRGVYVSETGIARIAGDVHLTRGQNQLDGDEALVNMRTGISTLIRDPGKRVQGLVIPNDANTKPGATPGAKLGSTPGAAKGAAPSIPAPKR